MTQSHQSVFGRHISVPNIDQYELKKEFLDHREALFFPAGQGQGEEKGDPNYWYLWPVKTERELEFKLTTGEYELVTPEMEQLYTKATSVNGIYELAEHVLVRMPIERYRALQAREEYRALEKERRLEDDFKTSMTSVSGGELHPLYQEIISK